jgi:dipeptidase
MGEEAFAELGMTTRTCRKILAALIVAALATLPASPVRACYAVVVGREASSDGSVLLGHAEQNFGRQMLNFRRVDRQQHDADAQVVLRRGARLPEVRQSWAFLWSELPGLEFSDNYLNEWGVAVVSDSCPSREDDYAELVRNMGGEIHLGGIGYMLRRLIAQRARSARDGVKLAGQLIETLGYVDSGRTYVIADPREAWLLAVARGSHWVARRVPDDQVVVLPNVYVTDTVDLSDPKNYLGSPDLVAYAVRCGWFHPQGGEPFRFDHAYGARPVAADLRRWQGQQLVSGKDIPWPPASQPFAVKPAEKLTVAAVARLLRSVIPADRGGTLATQEAAVFQLRAGLPREIGCIYWRTSGEPSLNVLLPWYLGIRQTPASYYRAADLKEALTLGHHFHPPAEMFVPDRRLAWWLHQSLQELVRRDLPGRLPAVRRAWDDLEKRAADNQAGVEKEALSRWQRDPDSACEFLTRYCAGLAADADHEALRLLETFRPAAHDRQSAGQAHQGPQ